MKTKSKIRKLFIFAWVVSIGLNMGLETHTVNAADFINSAASWSQVASGGPGERKSASTVYDSVRGKMILFGGCVGSCSASGPGSSKNDVWELDLSSNTWSQISTNGVSPGARSGHSAVYDSAADTMYIFGGWVINDAVYEDVWALENVHTSANWVKRSSSAPTGLGAPGLRGQSAVWHESTKTMIVFGGLRDDSRITHRVMIFNTQTNDWIFIKTRDDGHGHPNSWRALYNHSMVLSGNDLIVFGGRDAGHRLRNDVWILRNVTSFSNNSTAYWEHPIINGNPVGAEQKDPDIGCLPPSAPGGSFTNCADSDGIVGAGSSNLIDPSAGTAHADKWESYSYDPCLPEFSCLESYDYLVDPSDDDYYDVNVPDRPSKRNTASAFYDAANNQLLVYGGDLNDSGVWVLSNANGSPSLPWTKLNPTGTIPAARRSQAGIYDGSDDIFIYSGRPKTGTLNEVQKLHFTLPVPVAPTIGSGSTSCVGNSDPGNIVNWTDNSNNEDYWKVYRDTSSSFTPPSQGTLAEMFSSSTKAGTGATISRTDIDSGLTPGTTYYYKIIANNTNGDSTPSAAVSVIASSSCGPTVSGVTITPPGPSYKDSVLNSSFTATNWDSTTSTKSYSWQKNSSSPWNSGWSSGVGADDYNCSSNSCDVNNTVYTKGRGCDDETCVETGIASRLISNRVPILGSIGNKAVNEGELLSFDISGSDPDGDSLTYTVTNKPASATFSGVSFGWTPGGSDQGTYTLTFEVSDGNGGIDNEDVTITVNDATVDIKANGSNTPAAIAYNTAAVLSWTSANSSSCVASGDWSGAKALNNQTPGESTGNLTSQKTYTLTCNGVASDSVTVSVQGQATVDIKANGSDGPVTVANNGSADLTWTSANISAATCEASGDWSGTKAKTESTGVSTGALAGPRDYTYTLTCDSVSDSVVVSIPGAANSAPSAVLDIENNSEATITSADRSTWVYFDVSGSTDPDGVAPYGNISSVRFCTDDTPGNNGCDSSWTTDFNWNANSGDWNKNTKEMKWSFATPGAKGVYVEITDAGSLKGKTDGTIFINTILIVNTAGSGSGKVTATGINCTSTNGTKGGDCTETYNNASSVTLAASPTAPSTFDKWDFCDSTSGNNCTVAMSSDKSVTVTFKAPGNNNPMAVAGIRTGSMPSYFDSFPSEITVDKGQPVSLYLAAWIGPENNPTSHSDDVDGWTTVPNGMTSGVAKCEWDVDFSNENFNQDPNYVIDRPVRDFGESVDYTECSDDPNWWTNDNIIGGPGGTPQEIKRTFNNEGTFDFEVLRMTDSTGATSIATVRVNVVYNPCALGNDTTPPSASSLDSPADGSNQVAGTVTLKWLASTDNCGMSHYNVYISNSNPPLDNRGNTVGTSYNYGISCGLTYFWQIQSVDINNNTNASAVRSFNTAACPPDFWMQLVTGLRTINPGDGLQPHTIRVSSLNNFSGSVQLTAIALSTNPPASSTNNLEGKFSNGTLSISVNVPAGGSVDTVLELGHNNALVDTERGVEYTVKVQGAASGYGTKHVDTSFYINKRPNPNFTISPSNGINPLSVVFSEASSNAGNELVGSEGNSLKVMVMDLNGDFDRSSFDALKNTVDKCYWTLVGFGSCDSVFGAGKDTGGPPWMSGFLNSPTPYNDTTQITYGFFDDLVTKYSVADERLRSFGYITKPVTINNASPVAVAGISVDDIGSWFTDKFPNLVSTTFGSKINVPLLDTIAVHLAAWIGTEGAPTDISRDANGWNHSTLGMENGGKCEWDTNFDSTVAADVTNNTLPTPQACSAESSVNYLTRDISFTTPGLNPPYSVLRLTDKQSDPSNIATVEVDVKPYLTVIKEGSGDAVITGSGINCGTGVTDCTKPYDVATPVVLTASLAVNSSLASWQVIDTITNTNTGECPGNGLICSIVMSSNKRVSAKVVRPVVTIDPGETILRIGQTLQFKAWYDSDGDGLGLVDITSCVGAGNPIADCQGLSDWTSTNLASFSVTNVAGNKGLVRGLNRGIGKIMIEYDHDGDNGVSTPPIQAETDFIRILKYKWEEK